MIGNTVLKLIRTSLNADCPIDDKALQGMDWGRVMTIASAHGLAALAFEGLEKVLASNPERRDEIAKPLLMQWYGLCLRQTSLFEKNWRAASALSSLLAEHGIAAVVLKGRSIAQYYPRPEYRYSCDLDLFVAGDEWRRACEVLASKGIRLECEVYKEVEFVYEGVNVELHRYITPVRGNSTLLRFERYLRQLLEDGPKTYFAGTTLLCPPLTFIVMLYIEHALGDLLHGKLTLKHVVDWVVLRRKDIDRAEIEARCKAYGFDRFLVLIDALADVVEGKADMEALAPAHKEVMASLFVIPTTEIKEQNSWFARRVALFFEIVRSRRYYRRFGYCSMERFLLGGVWAHFFDKEVRL